MFAGGCAWWHRPPHSSLEFRLSMLVIWSSRCWAPGWSTPVLRHTLEELGSEQHECPLPHLLNVPLGARRDTDLYVTETWLPSGRPGSLKTDLRRGEGKESGTLSFEETGW